MKAKLGQNSGDGDGLFPVKLNPNPFANHFGKFKEIRGFLAEQSQKSFGVQGAVRLPAGGVNFCPFVGSI